MEQNTKQRQKEWKKDKQLLVHILTCTCIFCSIFMFILVYSLNKHQLFSNF